MGLFSSRPVQNVPLRPINSADLQVVKDTLPTAVARYLDLVAASASGSYVKCAQTGKQYLDMACGIGVTSTGHSHPAVAAALGEQAKTHIFAQQNCIPYHPPLVNNIRALKRILPDNLDKIFFTNSGSEAVDNAVKIARHRTKRPNVIVFDGSFHGRTVAAMSLTTSKTVFSQGMQVKMPGVVVSSFPNCLYCPVKQATEAAGGKQSGCCGQPLSDVEHILKTQSHPMDTAAVLVEPIQGEGGIVVPPPGFLQGLRRLCDKHGILLIIDEVQSGAGRSGKWWAFQHEAGLRADMMLFAKGIASGYPAGGVAMEANVLEGMGTGVLGGTYGGNSMAHAAMHATIGVIEGERLVENAAKRGEQLVTGLRKMAAKHTAWPVRDVRGRGLMAAIEFDADAAFASKVCKAAFGEELLLITAGSRAVIRFLPPLNISSAEIEEAIAKLERAIASVCTTHDVAAAAEAGPNPAAVAAGAPKGDKSAAVVQ